MTPHVSPTNSKQREIGSDSQIMFYDTLPNGQKFKTLLMINLDKGRKIHVITSSLSYVGVSSESDF